MFCKYLHPAMLHSDAKKLIELNKAFIKNRMCRLPDIPKERCAVTLSSTKSKAMTWLETTDQEFSTPIFASSLPYLVELVFSIPANWFGLAPSLLIGPLWFGLLLGNQEGGDFNWKLLIAAVFLTIPMLAAWISLLRGNEGAFWKIFAGKEIMTLSPFLSVAICHRLIDNPELFSMAVYPLCLWMPSLICVLFAKRTFLRKRPLADPNHSKFKQKKHFQVIITVLGRHSADESLPSGDAAGAMAFAIAAALSGHGSVGVIIALLACLGRVYYLAHHAMDTILGCLTTLMVHLVLRVLFGFSLTGLTWVHALSMNVCFVAAISAYISCRKKQSTPNSDNQ